MDSTYSTSCAGVTFFVFQDSGHQEHAKTNPLKCDPLFRKRVLLDGILPLDSTVQKHTTEREEKRERDERTDTKTSSSSIDNGSLVLSLHWVVASGIVFFSHSCAAVSTCGLSHVVALGIALLAA